VTVFSLRFEVHTAVLLKVHVFRDVDLEDECTMLSSKRRRYFISRHDVTFQKIQTYIIYLFIYLYIYNYCTVHIYYSWNKIGYHRRRSAPYKIEVICKVHAGRPTMYFVLHVLTYYILIS
jgi:hypothetical protein